MVNELDIRIFKYQLCEESLGLLHEDNPATYSIILKHFGNDLSEEQIKMLNDELLNAKAKMSYVNKQILNFGDLKPYDPNEISENYVINKGEHSSEIAKY